MIKPDYLQKGNTVAIVATARKIDLIELQPAVALLESWGLRVLIGSSIAKQQNQLAGSDDDRAADFQQMLDNPTVKAIWIARGGYGTVRIIDRLDFEQYKKHPKWVIGFSDITVIHNHFNNLGYQTIHAIMPLNIQSATFEAIESLRKAVFGEELAYSVKYSALNRPGFACGELIGGNLSVLYSILGSQSEVDMTGKVLFIEDLDEYLYHIDRMLFNLKRNQYFEKIQALIVGGMTDMKDNQIPWGKTAEEIIEDITSEYKFPVLYHFPAGHLKDNRALFLGRKVVVVVANDQVATVSFEE